MEVRVLLDKWGNYKKGDIIPDMPESTAKACIKSGAVESTEAKAAKPEKEEKPKTEAKAKK